MESTGYEDLNRRPGGDSILSSAATLSSKSLPSENGGGSFASHGERSLKSTNLQSVGSFCNSRPGSRKELHAEMSAARKPVVLQPPSVGTIGKPGVRKESPVASPSGSQQFLEEARNVRRRPSGSSPYNLRYIDTHAEDIFVHKGKIKIEAK